MAAEEGEPQSTPGEHGEREAPPVRCSMPEGEDGREPDGAVEHLGPADAADVSGRGKEQSAQDTCKMGPAEGAGQEISEAGGEQVDEAEMKIDETSADVALLVQGS